jgi:branched-chain amino acid transport system substrate-binding protein
VPLPAGDGLTFTCDGKQIPGLLSACSPGLVVLTITNGQGLDPQLIG